MERTGFSGVGIVRTQPDKFKKLDPGWAPIRVLARMKPSWFHFSAPAVVLAVAWLAGCAPLSPRAGARQPTGYGPVAEAQPLARLDIEPSGPAAKASALLIAAEFALQGQDIDEAARDYAAAAEIADDPAVAKRALQLAVASGETANAQKLLDRWRALGAAPRDLAGIRAQLAMLRGDRSGAEKDFDILLATGGADAWKTFAADLLAARDTALAGRILEDLAVAERLPRNENVWVALSQLGEHLGRHAFARKLADAAVQRFGGTDSIRWAASLKLSTGDSAGAKALYAKGVAAHPRDPALRLGYASVLGAAHEYGEALRVLADGPQTPRTWSARVAFAARAKDDAALQRLYAELKRSPPGQRADNAFLLGQLAELMHHDSQALDWYGQVDVDSEHGFEAKVRSAVLLDKTGKQAQAHALAAQLQQDYADDPDSLRTAYELDAQLYAQHGDHARAIAVYDRGLGALPGDPALIYDRGIEEANAGNTDAALRDFREVLARNPENIEAMNALGFTLADADRDLPEATRLLRKALAAKPDAAAIMDSWGWLQYRLGHLDEAESYLQRAWASHEDPDIGAHLGEVLWKLGQHRDAREVFAKVRKLDPHNAALQHAERRLRP